MLVFSLFMKRSDIPKFKPKRDFWQDCIFGLMNLKDITIQSS